MLGIRFCMAVDAPWDLLRTFEAVARHGSLTAAAKAIGASQSTVSRQLARLEEISGTPLLLRQTPVRLTERGAALRDAIEPMASAAQVARAALEDAIELRGEVTLTTVGEIVRWSLARRLGAFYRAHPHIRLRILASNERASLAAGDADLALRMARPERGDLVARKLGRETFGLFASSALTLGPEVPWLGLTGSLAKISEQKHADRVFAGRAPRLLVEDVEALGLSVQAGLGVAVLPRMFAAGLEGVVEVRPQQVGGKLLSPVPSRTIWLVVHESKRRVPKVRAVMDWLIRVFPR